MSPNEAVCIFLPASADLGWGAVEYLLHLCRGIRHSTKCPRYDIKQSDGEVLVVELWGMWSISSLSFPPASLGPKVVVPIRVPSVHQIKLFNHLPSLKKFQCANKIISISNTWNHLTVRKQISSGSFTKWYSLKNHMYKQDLAFDSLLNHWQLSIICKSDLTNKMKRSYFQAAVVSILLYGCTTWKQTKWLEKKLDGNYTVFRAILNKSWRQHPTRHKLYGHLPPIMKTIQVRRTRHAGHCWRSRDELISDVLLWTPTYARAKAGRLARTYSSYVRIRDGVLKTCPRRWTIGRSGERGPGISVLAARHDDDVSAMIKMWQSQFLRGGGGVEVSLNWNSEFSSSSTDYLTKT